MKALIFVLFLFALRINISKCQSPFSAFNCAMRRNALSAPKERLVTKLLKTATSPTRGIENYVFFNLHTRENPEGQLIEPGSSDSLKNSTFDSKRPTKFITHGYLNGKFSAACTMPRDAFLDSGDYNVIVVDWWPMQSYIGLIPVDYWTSVSYIGEISSYVAKMLNFLESHGMNLKTTTLIGHSLGAHVMGIAGQQTTTKVGYIVGLDPALPSFEFKGPGESLSPDDAILVEVIHTNSGECGIPYQVGHFDFYPNGGNKQPGCGSNVCSHSRAYEFFAESIYYENRFYGRRCRDFDSVIEGKCFGPIVKMGGDKQRHSAPYGLYHLKTRDSRPYALESEKNSLVDG